MCDARRRRLANTRAGLLAGLAFALVPSVSRFAQEARSYALEVLVATLATLMLLRALDRPAVHRWAAYGACVAALGYLDPVAPGRGHRPRRRGGHALVAGPG